MNGPQNDLDQKNLLLAIVLSAGVLLVWQAISPPIPVESMPPAPQPTTGAPTQDAVRSESVAPSIGGQVKAPTAITAKKACSQH